MLRPLRDMPTTTPSATDYFGFIQNQVYPSIVKALTHPAWTNPLTALLTVWLVTFLLELVLPKKKNYTVIGRKGFWLDLFYLFFIDFLFGAIGFIAFTYTVEYVFTNLLKKIGVELPLVHPPHLNPVLQFLIFFVIMDFCQFIAHYLLHRIEFFWKFHKIHHAQEAMGFASTRHFHFGEYLVLKPLGWIPFGLFGYSGDQYLSSVAIYFWVAYFFVFFSHCNVKIRFGFLSKIFITPENHYWHHARNIPRKYGVNYASVLMIWDYLFRSFYLPDDPKLEPVLGVPDPDVPKTFLGQTWYPFKTLFSKRKEKQSSIYGKRENLNAKRVKKSNASSA